MQLELLLNVMHQEGSHVQSRGKQITVPLQLGTTPLYGSLHSSTEPSGSVQRNSRWYISTLWEMSTCALSILPKNILRSRQIHVSLAADPTGTGADFCLLPKITPGNLRTHAYVWRLDRSRGSTARETDVYRRIVLTIIAIWPSPRSKYVTIGEKRA